MVRLSFIRITTRRAPTPLAALLHDKFRRLRTFSLRLHLLRPGAVESFVAASGLLLLRAPGFLRCFRLDLREHSIAIVFEPSSVRDTAAVLAHPELHLRALDQGRVVSHADY